MILLDTSVWIEAFRARGRLRIEEVVDFEEVVTCLPVVLEVLQGFAGERAHRIAREAMLSLPIVESPLGLDRFEEAITLYRTARRSGRTIRSSVDCLIAACAIRHDLEGVQRDRDDPAPTAVSSLRVRGV